MPWQQQFAYPEINNCARWNDGPRPNLGSSIIAAAGLMVACLSTPALAVDEEPRRRLQQNNCFKCRCRYKEKDGPAYKKVAERKYKEQGRCQKRAWSKHISRARGPGSLTGTRRAQIDETLAAEGTGADQNLIQWILAR